jgi:uncharacterized membrane protein
MSQTSRQSESHIDAIVRQEEEALERRSGSERLADGVGGFAGSLPFVVLHLVFLIGWLLVNSGKIPTIRPFDPYPFSLLGVIVAVEAVVLSSFILMRQNRMMRRGERRDHLNLQVDLLAEKEITKVLQMVRAICGHMGLQNIMADSEIRELSENTSIESLSQTVPLENSEMREQKGIILPFTTLLRCSFFSRHSSALCARSSVRVRCSSWRT